MSSNDRRHRDDREELREEREKNERITRERDEFERKYYHEVADNNELRRQLSESERARKAEG